MRRVLSAVAIAASLTLASAPALATQSESLKVSPGEVHAGGYLKVSGRCSSHEVDWRQHRGKVELELDGKVFGYAKADKHGWFYGGGNVPDVKPGRYKVHAKRGKQSCGDTHVKVRDHKRRTYLVVKPRVVGRGEPIFIYGGGCKPGSKVTFYLDGHKIGAKTSSKHDGSFHDFAKIPKRTHPGKHLVSAVCHGKLIGVVKIRVVKKYPGPCECPHGHSNNLAVSQSTVVAGKAVSFSAPSCESGASDASLDDTKLVLASPARSGGLYNASATIPKGTPAGTYTLATRCNGQVAGAATVRVTPAALGAGLPTARTNIVPGLAAGVALICLGGLTLLGIKRRRTGAHTAR